MTPEASVVISTLNRSGELARALESVMHQTVACEVIVLDDGSTDGTAQMVRREFPTVRLEAFDRTRGSLGRRNLGVEMATAPIVISLDDDSELPSPRTVAETLPDFDHPRIAAVTIPYYDAPQPQIIRQRAPDESGRYLVPHYLGCHAAIRKDAFLAVGGYREVLHHSGEEVDLSIRLLESGWVVRAGRADPGVHHVSPLRNPSFAARHATRSQILIEFLNTPAPWVVSGIGRQLVVAALRAGRRRSPGGVLRGVADAVRTATRERALRAPLRPELYAVYRQIARAATRRRGGLTLEEVEARLPPLAPTR